MQEFILFRQGKEIGEAKLSRQGLYYELNCSCRMKAGRFRVIMESEKGLISAGLLRFAGKEGFLKRKISVSSAGKTIKNIQVLEDAANDRDFTELMCDRPFTQIAKLADGKFGIVNGKKGIFFP